MITKTSFISLLVWIVFAGVASRAQAGVFTMPHFVAPGEFSLGMEGELTLTHGAGAAANVKYTQGLNDLMNATAILGTGGGPRKFRAGGNLIFDIFPDIEGQPGIGLGTQALYYRLPEVGQLELTAVPYIHKTFISAGNEIEPYFAIPFGAAFSEGRYKAISNVAIGSMFKSVEHFRYTLEFGIAVNNSDTYVTGGIAYFH